MLYENLDPSPPRRLRNFVRWRMEQRRNPPPPSDLQQLPQVAPNDGSLLRSGHDTLTWAGHASVVIQLDGKTLVCDPVWSLKLSGVVKRLSPPGLPLDLIPRPDAVLISHNHYDHLDMPTLKRLGRDIELFVPAGLARFFHQQRFHNVHEFGWWGSTDFGGLRISFVPSQHWSRRLPWDTNRSWWGGWMIEGSQRVYFAGDTGFFSGFKQIAERFAPPDWAIMPIGAYDPPSIMQPVHMNPAEAVEAFGILKARQMLPIHYGTFRLTAEPLGEPPRWLQQLWREQNLDPSCLWIPQLGETRRIDLVPTLN